MPEPRREIKDSVFTYLFRQPEYTRQLYLALHPEDEDVTEQELKLVTLEPVLTAGLYNDLGFQVRDKLLLLMEAQSTFSKNLALRVLLYLSETYRAYAKEHKLNLYSTKPLKIPRPELYVVFTGDDKNVPDTLLLSDLYEGQGSVEVKVKVIRSEGGGDIISQYVRFCKISDENTKLYGKTIEALDATINQCIKEGILVPFLESRRKEVTDIMITLFSYDEIQEMHDNEIRRESRAEGRSEGRAEGRSEGRAEGRDEIKQLYGELMKRLMPLGRIDELIDASSDSSKLSNLAKEFGLPILPQ